MNEKKAVKAPKKQNFFVRLLTLLATAALVLGALLLVVYRDQLNLDALRRWMAYRDLETSPTGEAAPFTHAGGDQMSVAYLDTGILTASSAGAHYYSFTGQQYAEQVLSLEHPVLTASRKTGVVYDAGGSSLFLYRAGSESPALTLEGGAGLLSARPNDTGWLAVTAQQSGYKGAVTVYDSFGEKVIQISLSSTFVVDAALSPDCRTVAVATMGQEGGAFFSRLLFFPVNQEEPSAQVELGSTVVLDLDYEQDRVWVLGEDRVVSAAPDGSESATYHLGRNYLKGCSLGGDGFALVLTSRYRMGSATQALVIDASGQAAYTLSLSGQVLDLSAAGNYCALLTGGGLTIYTSDLEPYAALEATQGARHVALSPNGSALLANSQQAWLYIPQ